MSPRRTARRPAGGDRKALDGMLERRARIAADPRPAAAARLRDIDRRIRGRFERTVAPFVLDMAGFTRLTVAHGILHYLTMIHRMVALCGPAVVRHRGSVVKTEADNLFAWFPDVERAVAAALEIHSRLADANLSTDDDSDIHTSIGIGWGPTLVLDDDMWGGEFNLASKLGEDIAGAGEVLLTGPAHRELRGGPYSFRRRPVNVGGMPYAAWLLRLHARRAAPRGRARKGAKR